MLEILQRLIKNAASPERKLHLVREFLQTLILKTLSDKNAFTSLVFVGGTALRIVHNLNRFSEELDFSLLEKSNFDFLPLMHEIQRECALRGLEVELKPRINTVQACFIGFVNLLPKLGMASSREHKLLIKLEVDSNPPAGGNCELPLVNNHFIFPLRTYDLPSLMAGKLHAVLNRRYTKGRDYYDLLWYLTSKIQPNLTLLNNALLQTDPQATALHPDTWKSAIKAHLSTINFEKVRMDALPFLLEASEAAQLDATVLSRLLD